MMKYTKIRTFLIIILIFTIISMNFSSSAWAMEKNKDYVQGEILVKYKNNKINLNTDTDQVTTASVADSQFLEIKENLGLSNVSVLKITDDKTVEEKIDELKNDPNVEYAEPNYLRYQADIPTDDKYKDLLWGLDNTGQEVNGIIGTTNSDINAPEAWLINKGTNSYVTVAVIDNGVDYNHPDLVANMWDGKKCNDENGNPIIDGCNHGYDYEDNDQNPLPSNSSHGTHIAGIISASENKEGVVGVAPNSKIMAIKFGLDVASEVKAIDFAIQNGAKVINASFIGPEYSKAEYDAINRFKANGGIFVASAGNGGSDYLGDNNENGHQYPSDYNLDNIISVAATDQNDHLAPFSNFGTESVDVAAPGVNIYSTVANDQYDYMSGTSMSAPYVSGLAALIEGFNPNLSYLEVKNIILTSGDDLDSLSSKTVSGKRINAQKALQAAMPVTPKSITSFTIPSQIGETLIDENAHTIKIIMPKDTDLTKLTPTITINGESISPLSELIQDFSNPVNYTVTATNSLTQDYVVTVVIDTTAPVVTRVNHSSGGGGGSSTRILIPNSDLIISPELPILKTLTQNEGCLPGYLFSPITGQACSYEGQVLGVSSYHFSLLLKIGSVDNEVLELQKFLNNSGYDCGTLDGKFGLKTKNAIISLQKTNKLTPDGIVGSMTRSILNK